MSGVGPSGEAILLPATSGDKHRGRDGRSISPPPEPPMPAPYLDVFTISSAQFPTAIDGGKNQESHSRLLVEPVTVPNLDHTGIGPNLKKRESPLFYPNGSRNCNLRDTIRTSLRESPTGLGSSGELSGSGGLGATSGSGGRGGAGGDAVGSGGGAEAGTKRMRRSVRVGATPAPKVKRAKGRPRKTTKELAAHTKPRRRGYSGADDAGSVASARGSVVSSTSLRKRPVDRSTMDLLKEMQRNNEKMARALERCG